MGPARTGTPCSISLGGSNQVQKRTSLASQKKLQRKLHGGIDPHLCENGWTVQKSPCLQQVLTNILNRLIHQKKLI